MECSVRGSFYLYTIEILEKKNICGSKQRGRWQDSCYVDYSIVPVFPAPKQQIKKYKIPLTLTLRKEVNLYYPKEVDLWNIVSERWQNWQE